MRLAPSVGALPCPSPRSRVNTELTPPELSPRCGRRCVDSPEGGSLAIQPGVGDAVGLPRSEQTETSVKVLVRFRPPVNEEEQQDAMAFVVHPGGRAVETVDGSYHFEFDRAFSEATSQETVYNHVGRPIIDAVLGGYNGTIFAYGQTGSGKTHSMIGPTTGQDEYQGIVPRAAQQIFDYIDSTEPDASDDTEFTLRCSFLEVYREQMRDLLIPQNQKLRVKELPQRGLFVDGLSREYVTCKAEVMSVLRAGLRARSVARTRQNQHSSRSHGVFVLHVEQRSFGGGADSNKAERFGKLTLVDLAGSEKVSKSECVGESLEEAKKINWSLSALGKVIDALAEQRPHVPYRDSRLTRVLQEALGGNCRTTLLVAASACSQHYDETLSSLRFAARTQKVRNHAKVNYMYSSDQLLLLVAQLQRDLLSAKKQITQLSLTAQAGRSEQHSGGNNGKAILARQNSTPTEGHRRSRGKRTATPIETPDSCGNSVASSLRLMSSGSAPALSLNFAKFGGSGCEEEERKLYGASFGERCLKDIDETSCLNHPSTSFTSLGSPRSASSRGSDEDDEATYVHTQLSASSPHAERHSDDEAWRSVALAAREALGSLETALLAQEQALEEARLLLPRCEDVVQALRTPATSSGGSSAVTPNAGAGGAGCRSGQDLGNRGASPQLFGRDVLSERFRALRHAVDARGLQWRLQLERHRTESLSLELEMRRRYSEELEQSLQEQTARLHEALQVKASDNLGDAMRRVPPLRRTGSLAPGGGSVAGGTAATRSASASGVVAGLGGASGSGSSATAPPGAAQRGCATGPFAGSAAPGHTRIKRPVLRCPRGTGASPGLTASRGALGGSPSAGGGGGGSNAPVAANWASEAPAPSMTGSWSLCGNECTPGAAACEDRLLRVAGTGDSGDAGSIGGSPEFRAELDRATAAMRMQMEALQGSHDALQAQVARLQSELSRRGSQVTELAAELGARDVRVSALRHEVLVKDALLKKLGQDSFKRAEGSEEEVECLLEQAMSPLVAMLTREQAMVAVGFGERAAPPAERLRVPLARR